jgi:hypothetical protein
MACRTWARVSAVAAVATLFAGFGTRAGGPGYHQKGSHGGWAR